MKALYLEEPDRIPFFDFIFNPDIFRKVLGHFPPTGPKDWIECTRRIGLDALWLAGDASRSFKLRAGPERGSFYDEWGEKCIATSEKHWPIPYIAGHPLEDIERLKDYEPPDPHAEGRTRTVEKAVKLAKDDMAILSGVGGPFSNAALLTGFTTYSVLLYSQPQTIHKLAKMVTDFYIEVGKRFIDVGVDGIFISDDLGTDTSLFISPSHFKQFVYPYLKSMVSAFHKKGAAVLLHSDGNINAIVGDLVETGIDALHPVQRMAKMNMTEIKEKFGDRICLIGNIDVTHTLPFGTKDEIMSQTIDCIRNAAPGGGYVLASDHSLTGVSLERANIMFDIGRKHGVYPIPEK
jgi:uroporphyrinogen-III decarboxylase